jgi:hypothetical protein
MYIYNVNFCIFPRYFFSGAFNHVVLQKLALDSEALTINVAFQFQCSSLYMYMHSLCNVYIVPCNLPRKMPLLRG